MSSESAHYNGAVLNLNAIIMFIFSKLGDFCRNPATIIRSVFCANFYFTCLHNYEVAFYTCRKTLQIIEQIEKSPFGRTYCLEVFPVCLSSDSMPLFDESIQTVFGFVSLFICVGYEKEVNRGNLFKFPPQFFKIRSTEEEQICRKTHSRHSRVISSLVVQLCPAAFIKYIGLQCQKQLRLGHDCLFGMYKQKHRLSSRQHHSIRLLLCANSITHDRRNCVVNPTN